MELLIDLDKLPIERISDKIVRKRVLGEKSFINIADAKRGAIIPKHEHEVEQITIVLSGVLKLVLNEKEFSLTKNKVLIVPAGVQHQGEVLEDAEYIDYFPSHVKLFKLTE